MIKISLTLFQRHTVRQFIYHLSSLSKINTRAERLFIPLVALPLNNFAHLLPTVIIYFTVLLVTSCWSAASWACALPILSLANGSRTTATWTTSNCSVGCSPNTQLTGTQVCNILKAYIFCLLQPLGWREVLPLCYEQKNKNLPWKKQKIIKTTDIQNVQKSQNQTWNIRFLHIKIKVICGDCIKLLTSSSLFWTYWEFSSRLAASQMYEVT